MKKVIALVMCVAMIACIAVTASADTAVTVTIGTVEGKAGDVVEVPISFSEESNLGAWELMVSYDADVLEATTTLNKKKQPVYFLAGDASTAAGALVEGSEGGNPMKLTGATTNGYWDGGVVVTVYFKVLKDIPEGQTAAIKAEMTVAKDCEKEEVKYDATVVAGGVKAPAAPIVDPSKPTDESSVPSDVTPVTPDKPADKDNNPPTGDASAIAVATGLCAVMAAAFVITKKVND